jgi:uncharacterized protein YlaN (UPF0358 family)
MKKHLKLAHEFAEEVSQNTYDMENACYLSYTTGFLKALDIAIKKGLITPEQGKELMNEEILI